MAKKEATGPPKDVAAYLNAPYVRMIITNADEGGYLAEVLELPGCISEGETPEEAFRNVDEAMAGWITAALDMKRPIPDPVGDNEYSGHLPLRISSELHRFAALRALQEGTSLNQWIAKAIATQLAKANLADELADQVATKVAERVRLSAMTLVNVGVRDTNPRDPYPSVMPADAFPDVRSRQLDEPKGQLATQLITWDNLIRSSVPSAIRQEKGGDSNA